MPAEKRDHGHHDGSSTRAFTAEQKAAVIRVRRCKNTDFYDILGLEEVKVTCSDGEIKKAYRKLSLLTHPDKNGYDGADEAFKMVSRAFQILSDPDKKMKYDKFGGDPDSRFGAGASASGASPFSGFASQRTGPRQGDMFGEEISPEDLFRQFFGGGMGGQPFGGPFGFGGGPGFVFNVGGGPGIRVQQMGGGFPRRRPHNHTNADGPTSTWAAIQGLLPIILLVLVPLLSSLFSDAGPSYPAFKWEAQPPQTHLHTSSRLKIPYYVNPLDVQEYTSRKWRELDKIAETRFVHHLDAECQWEQNQRQRMFQEAQGFWRRDEEKWEAAKQYQMPSCQRLEGWGYRVTR